VKVRGVAGRLAPALPAAPIHGDPEWSCGGVLRLPASPPSCCSSRMNGCGSPHPPHLMRGLPIRRCSCFASIVGRTSRVHPCHTSARRVRNGAHTPPQRCGTKRHTVFLKMASGFVPIRSSRLTGRVAWRVPPLQCEVVATCDTLAGSAAILRSQCFSQYRLSFSAKPRWGPRSSGDVAHPHDSALTIEGGSRLPSRDSRRMTHPPFTQINPCGHGERLRAYPF